MLRFCGFRFGENTRVRLERT